MKQALMLPLGEGDFKRGLRLNLLRDFAPMLHEIGCTVGVEYKGDDLPLESGNWVDKSTDILMSLDGVIVWHPPNKFAWKLGDPSEPVSPLHEKAAQQATVLRREKGLKLMTIHLAPAQYVERTGEDRYESLIEAEDMLSHIEHQIDPLCRLAELSDGTLSMETVDIINFADQGFKLPTYLMLQTGAGRELKYIQKEVKRRSGFHVNITVDPEHVICSSNVLQRRRDMRGMPYSRPENPTEAQIKLAEITGYWLEKGKVPFNAEVHENLEGNVRNALELFNPELLHLGAAEQAETDIHEIDTHLPYNPWDNWQMELLDELLQWSKDRQDNCCGWVIEVAGRRVSERYSPWSARPEDDEVAKLMSYLVVIDRLKSLIAS